MLQPFITFFSIISTLPIPVLISIVIAVTMILLELLILVACFPRAGQRLTRFFKTLHGLREDMPEKRHQLQRQGRRQTRVIRRRGK